MPGNQKVSGMGELGSFSGSYGEDHKSLIMRSGDRIDKVAAVFTDTMMLLVHNHPSGDPTPSKADIAVTKDIVNAGKPLGVTVHDHVIIGRGRHTSLRDMGLLS